MYSIGARLGVNFAPPAPRRAGIDLQRIRNLREALGQDKLEILVGLLSIELTERPATIRAAAARDDWAGVRAHAHSFTGATDSMGLTGVAQAAMGV